MKIQIFVAIIMMFTGSALLAKAKSSCEACIKIEKSIKEYESDEHKAYGAFETLMSTFKLSKDKDVRRQELEAVVRATVLMLPMDNDRNLIPYLNDITKDYPKDLEAALKTLAPEVQKDIETQLNNVRKFMEQGEEDGN